jgi:hypothetical protein
MRADPALVMDLARAFRCQRLLDEGRFALISEMAVSERIERGYLGSLRRLTLLAPNLIEALLDRREPEDVTFPRVLKPFPLRWSERQQVLDRRRSKDRPVFAPNDRSGRRACENAVPQRILAMSLPCVVLSRTCCAGAGLCFGMKLRDDR